MLEVIKKRVLISLYTFKFVIITSLLLSLILFSLLTSLNTFEKRRTYYNEDVNSHFLKLDPFRILTYSNVELGFDKPPEKLSFLVEGIGEKYGSCAIIKGKYGSTIIKSRERANFFIFKFLPLDFIHIVGLVISLMAILFSYDIISGERETGTLCLSLSNPIGKYKIIFGEYIGIMLTLLIPISFCYLAVMIVLLLYSNISFDTEILGGISLLYVNSIFLVSIFVLLGILLSSLTRQSNISLLSSFLIWTFLVVIFPTFTTWISLHMRPVKSLAELTSSDILTKISPEFLKENKARVDPREKELNLNERFEQYDFRNRLNLISPFSNYILSSQIITGTDVDSYKRFIIQIKKLEQSFISWQKEKLEKYPNREFSYMWGWGPLDLEGLPSNEFKNEKLIERTNRALSYMAISIIQSIILFSLSYVFFIKYDPRVG